MSEHNNIDPVLQRQLMAESEKAKFQLQVHSLTETCWEKCVDKPNNKLDSRAETCLQSCVERFIDSSNFIVNRLEELRKKS
jgi:import inner membrane translocase subunit TIM8